MSVSPVVIVAAFRASRWIEDAIASIAAQTLVPDLAIGVDGCVETAELLARRGVAHYLSAANVGTYVMRNSLVSEHPDSSHLVIFDADDVMDPNYVETLVGLAGSDGIAGSDRIQCDSELVPTGRGPFVNGVCVISRAAWEAVGGYRPERIVADHDLIVRARRLGVPVRRCGEALYRRRRHPDSLTMTPETALRSRSRLETKRAMRRDVEAGVLRVTPVTVRLAHCWSPVGQAEAS